MKARAILVQLDADTARQLEKYAPARSRRRSQFIRDAIRRRIMQLEEERTAQAYRRLPDDEPWPLDPSTWERAPHPRRPRKPSRARRRRT
jgi:predicted transcriptional regulator